MKSNQTRSLIIAAGAAFCVYFCMYAFRKPFTAATYEDYSLYGFGLKSILVVAQLIGYTISKFIGIRVVAEMPAHRRTLGLILLIAIAELALVGFAFVPLAIKPLMLFVNGLPLGMVFGLTLAYLEGRRQTEALSAVLCASFIMSSGVVKSIGRWMVEDVGVSEFSMPMLVGLLFLLPFLLATKILQLTPPPDELDKSLRAERKQMAKRERSAFVSAYWPGLACFIFVYIALTVVRTVRDDFGVEIWRDMGVTETPSVFAVSETLVAVIATALNALAILIAGNLVALRATIVLMAGALGLVIGSTFLEIGGWLSPFGFMVSVGIGLYIPYVAFHTTLFERLIASSRLPANLGFLMYLADAIGYLGYAALMLFQGSLEELETFLPTFQFLLVGLSVLSFFALMAALVYFEKKLGPDQSAEPVNQTI